MKLGFTLAVLVTGAAGIGAAAVPNFAGASVVQVSLADYKFVPPRIVLKAGKPVVLRLQNAADQPHEFAAPEFFRNAQIRSADAKAVNDEGEAKLDAGRRVDIALIPKAGTYHLQCNKPGHAAMGMQGTIVVQ